MTSPVTTDESWKVVPNRRRGTLVASTFAVALAVVALALAIRAPRDRDGAPTPILAYRVDINTADEAELRLLPEIGAGLARRIVDDRAAGGPFADVDSLARVRGIGPARLESIRPWAIAGRSP